MPNACEWLNLESMPSTLVRKKDNGWHRSTTDAGVSGLVRLLDGTEQRSSDDDEDVHELFMLLLLLLDASVQRLFGGELLLSPLSVILVCSSPVATTKSQLSVVYTSTQCYDTIRYDMTEEFNVDSKAEYSALSSTRSQQKYKKEETIFWLYH